ncbi:putative pth11-like integral membrane protein [Neofusicoccum parvum]|uniref:Pth11-like integral membrane protein n=1 Tax=Neofusicoccum parvum TaxID=310453 RepID=A0ACB5RSA8_9PEZI|nr:putative pth11-like integral membrane protein [Neofusicoccum parvum]
MRYTAAAQRVVTASYILTAFSLFFLVLKLYTRYRVVRSLGWDDALVTLSFLVAIPLTIALHFDLMVQVQWLWVSTWIYVLSLGLSKLSILAQYLRIFVARRTVQAVWVCIAFVGAYTFQSVIVGILSCNPPAKYWDPAVPGFCINYTVYYYVAASLNIITDFAIILVPIPALVSLNVSRTKKVGVMLLFSIGGFGCVVSIIRLWTLYRLDRAGPDVSSANALAALWSAIEIHVCILCACLPSLSPVLTLVLRSLGLHLSTRGGPAGKDPSPAQTDSSAGRRWPGHQRRRGYPGRRYSGGVFSTLASGAGGGRGSEAGFAAGVDEEEKVVGVELMEPRKERVRVRGGEVGSEFDAMGTESVRTGSVQTGSSHAGERSDASPILYLDRS